MNIKELIKQPEGLRLEFKGELPEHADLAKTIIAFANDAGGELYVGISDNPRSLVGIAEDDLFATEAKISNISFDSELVVEKPAHQLNIDSFAFMFKEKTGEAMNAQILRKLELTKEMNGVMYPTNALVLFSDDELRNTLFHFAKVECARFKGTTTDVFIDQKSITTNIAIQAEEAYNFVLRHINRGATVEGVYTVSQWEYPIKAVREAIRNAVVHRDYSLAGKDVKVAIYDDMIEITSPGLLPPSIDFSAMNSRQSDARNKVVAPVFKRLGIIDQWGNGLKLIADELKAYPQIGFQWKDSGLSFQIQFVKLDFVEGQELRAELGQELQQDSDIEQQKTRADLRAELQQEQQDLQQEFGAGLGQGLQQEQQKPGQELGQEQQDLRQELQQDLQQELQKQTLYSVVLQCLVTEILARQEISNALGHKKGSGQLNKVILKLIENKLIERTIPENLNHPMQKFRITQRGKMFLELLTNR